MHDNMIIIELNQNHPHPNRSSQSLFETTFTNPKRIHYILLSIPALIVFTLYLNSTSIQNKSDVVSPLPKYINTFPIRFLRNTNNKNNSSQIQTDLTSYNNITSLFSSLSTFNFEGNWSSHISTIGNSTSGLFFFSIYADYKERPSSNQITLISKAIEGNYVDNWNLIYTYIHLNDIIFTNKSSMSSIKANCTSTLQIGKVFDNIKKKRNCATEIELEIEPIKNSYKLKGKLNLTSCDYLSFNFSLIQENQYAGYNIINFYTIILCLFCCGYFLSIIWLKHLLFKSSTYSDSFALFTVVQNAIWTICCSISHFIIIFTYTQYALQFLIISLLSLLTFIFADIPFILLIWRNKYDNPFTNINNNRNSIKSNMMLCFYLCLYCLFVLSIFFIKKLYFDSKFILGSIIITWLPQIIYNSLYHVQIYLPFVYVLFISLYRLFLPCYFKGYQYNFYLITPKYNIVILALVLMFITVVLLHLQKTFGARWFLPYKMRRNVKGKYCSEKEYKGLKKEGYLERECQCVICLKSLLKENMVNVSVTNDDDFDMNIFDTKDYGVFWNIFYFKEKKVDYTNKTLFVSECKHVFHSWCIDQWLKVKGECPYCRKVVMVK